MSLFQNSKENIFPYIFLIYTKNIWIPPEHAQELIFQPISRDCLYLLLTVLLRSNQTFSRTIQTSLDNTFFWGLHPEFPSDLPSNIFGLFFESYLRSSFGPSFKPCFESNFVPCFRHSFRLSFRPSFGPALRPSFAPFFEPYLDPPYSLHLTYLRPTSFSVIKI